MNNFPTNYYPPTVEGIAAQIRDANSYLTEKFAETDRLQKETDRLQKETDRLQKENSEQAKEYNRDIWAKFAETDKLHKEISELAKETWRLAKANCKEIGGISKSNGEIAEAYFYRCFKKYPQFAGQDFQTAEANKTSSSEALNLEDEYDIVLYNGTSIGIIEVKYKATKEDVAQVLKKPETFKKLFPYFKDYSFYLGLAGFHIYKNAEEEAIKQGVAIIKQEGKKMVINDAHLKVF
jgi:hypothetical protein